MLYNKIISDMKEAMINKDKASLSTIRLLKSAIDLYRINNKLEEVNDEVVIEVASKQVKTHRESVVEFDRAGRSESVQKLQAEIKLLENYLPKQLSKEEISIELDKIFEEVQPSGKQDLGKIMKCVSVNLKGKADMKLISEMVNERINS